jgi:hypothetical protein
LIPGFSLRSNPGLKLANAFGVSTFDWFTSIQAREVERSQKDPEGEHDEEEIVFEWQVQVETALGVSGP